MTDLYKALSDGVTQINMAAGNFNMDRGPLRPYSDTHFIGQGQQTRFIPQFANTPGQFPGACLWICPTQLPDVAFNNQLNSVWRNPAGTAGIIAKQIGSASDITQFVEMTPMQYPGPIPKGKSYKNAFQVTRPAENILWENCQFSTVGGNINCATPLQIQYARGITVRGVSSQGVWATNSPTNGTVEILSSELTTIDNCLLGSIQCNGAYTTIIRNCNIYGKGGIYAEECCDGLTIENNVFGFFTLNDGTCRRVRITGNQIQTFTDGTSMMIFEANDVHISDNICEGSGFVSNYLAGGLSFGGTNIFKTPGFIDFSKTPNKILIPPVGVIK